MKIQRWCGDVIRQTTQKLMCLFLKYHVVYLLYLGRVLWASAAQLMSQQGKGLKELTTSTYVV
jgi:hypothetical protein